MTIIFILFNLLLQSNVLARPLLPLHSTFEILSAPADRFQDRSEVSIVWSCFTTLFAVSWVAIHPNIPAKSDGVIRVFLRRLMIMVYMLLVPEAVILWAGRQWYAAGMIAKEHEGWTRTHGYFALMGGFMLCDEKGKEIETLQMYRLEALKKENKIIWPDITKDQIEDRSKGDVFSKGFAVVQTTWFIIQIIARGAYGLAITELELATVAFAFLNGILYFLWWDKPLDVACPLPVYQIPSSNPTQESAMQPGDSGYGEISDHKMSPMLSSSSSMPDSDLKSLGYEDDGFSEEGDLSAKKLKSNGPSQASQPKPLHHLGPVQRFSKRVMDTVLLPPRMFWQPVKLMATQYHIPDSDTIRPLSVPTFYAPCQVNFVVPVVIGMCVGITFGGIHCIAWSFSFLSIEEKWMWRVSALAITGIPLLAAFIVSIVTNAFGIMGSFRFIFEALMGGWIETFCAVLYFISRLFLLILPLVALRRLPHKALLDMNWSSFLPHI